MVIRDYYKNTCGNILNKHRELINTVKSKMIQASNTGILDVEHGIIHVNSTVILAATVMDRLLYEGKEDFDPEVCIIAAYCHDVGRADIKGALANHEFIGAMNLRSEMGNKDRYGEYTERFKQDIYNAIIYHKWSMQPQTTEGLIVRDADKLDWLSKWRWEYFKENDKKKSDIDIVELLPRLKDEILNFQCSKQLYDEMIYEIKEDLKHYGIKHLI